VRIGGSIDRIDRLPSGGVEILDYKTGRPGTQETVDESLQLSIYALACRDTLGLGAPERVTLYYTEAATRMSTTRTDDQLDAARDELLSRAALIVPAVGQPLLAPSGFLDDRRPTVSDAIDDLDGYSPAPSSYVRRLNEKLRPPAGPDPEGPGNRSLRRHGPRTTLRFKLHLALARHGVGGDVFSIGNRVDRDQVRERLLSILGQSLVPAPLLLEGSPILDPTTGVDIGRDHQALADSLLDLATRKHSQRALVGDQPSPTILSLPDDFVHHREPRTLSVREMARLQSFPDAFRFYAKETTGGQSRKADVPQYTQVGNAVPPWMAYRVGMRLFELLAESAAPGARGQGVPVEAAR
jgi:hypothetical protein